MVGMSFWLWNGASLLSALVDSAVFGSHDEASLFWTSVSFDANRLQAPRPMTITAAATNHLVTGPVSFPATARCMTPLQHFLRLYGIGVFPDAQPTPPESGL